MVWNDQLEVLNAIFWIDHFANLFMCKNVNQDENKLYNRSLMVLSSYKVNGLWNMCCINAAVVAIDISVFLRKNRFQFTLFLKDITYQNLYQNLRWACCLYLLVVSIYLSDRFCVVATIIVYALTFFLRSFYMS